MTLAEIKRKIEALEAQARRVGPGEIEVLVYNDPSQVKLHSGPAFDIPKDRHPTPEEYLAYKPWSLLRLQNPPPPTRLVIRL
jgi:hypothetical protein